MSRTLIPERTMNDSATRTQAVVVLVVVFPMGMRGQP
jgi:hypothetical protein